jgi:hypothetical protein
MKRKRKTGNGFNEIKTKKCPKGRINYFESRKKCGIRFECRRCTVQEASKDES